MAAATLDVTAGLASLPGEFATKDATMSWLRGTAMALDEGGSEVAKEDAVAALREVSSWLGRAAYFSVESQVCLLTEGQFVVTPRGSRPWWWRRTKATKAGAKKKKKKKKNALRYCRFIQRPRSPLTVSRDHPRPVPAC